MNLHALRFTAFIAGSESKWHSGFVQSEKLSWGAHPPRVWLDAPRVQPLAQLMRPALERFT